MKLKLFGIFLDDQDMALKFYTDILGFTKKLDFPTGKFKWVAAALFFVADIQTEYARLKKLNVTFTKEPTKAPGSTFAVLDDTCGNLIQLVQLG